MSPPTHDPLADIVQPVVSVKTTLPASAGPIDAEDPLTALKGMDLTSPKASDTVPANVAAPVPVIVAFRAPAPYPRKRFPLV